MRTLNPKRGNLYILLNALNPKPKSLNPHILTLNFNPYLLLLNPRKTTKPKHVNPQTACRLQALFSKLD